MLYTAKKIGSIHISGGAPVDSNNSTVVGSSQPHPVAHSSILTESNVDTVDKSGNSTVVGSSQPHPVAHSSILTESTVDTVDKSGNSTLVGSSQPHPVAHSSILTESTVDRNASVESCNSTADNDIAFGGRGAVPPPVLLPPHAYTLHWGEDRADYSTAPFKPKGKCANPT